jgi:hypothetical protein
MTAKPIIFMVASPFSREAMEGGRMAGGGLLFQDFTVCGKERPTRWMCDGSFRESVCFAEGCRNLIG